MLVRFNLFSIQPENNWIVKGKKIYWKYLNKRQSCRSSKEFQSLS